MIKRAATFSSTTRTTAGARRVAVATLALLLGSGSIMPAREVAATEPASPEGAGYLPGREGGTRGDFELVYEQQHQVAHGGGTLWAGKYVDQRSGEVHVVYRDPTDGAVAGPELAQTRREAALARVTPMQAKADAELRAAVAAAQEAGVAAAEAGAEPSLPVGVWLDVDVAAAEQQVVAAHPELTWDGDQPIVGDLDTARRIRAELDAARASARSAALEQLGREVAALGGTVAYSSTAAPLAYVDVPASAVESLAALPNVATLGLERTWLQTMSAAAPAVQADWTFGGEDQGAGVRVAVVEYHSVRNSGDMAGRVVAAGPPGRVAYANGVFDHPTWVAGAIAGGSPYFPGVAPGAHIVSAATGGGGASLTRDRYIIEAADWAASAAGGDADIVNASIGQDTATGSEEARRYFDALVHEQGRLAVAAAGNYTTFGNWNIVSPGTAYNVLTVGGIDDRGTAGRNDDIMWFRPGSNGSNFHDLTGTAWNSHGDFNKPNVSAPAPSVRTANGLTASGTSVASPIVAGIAAQVLARAPSLALRPEATRAIIMASAINHSPMPDGSINANHEGTGTASALWANRILNGGDGVWGGHRLGTMVPGEVLTQEISVLAGQKVKVAFTWNSHTSGSSIGSRTDRLMADFDLRVFGPDGSVTGSYSFDNNYEWVELTASHTGTARIEVRATRFEASAERYGLAWTKWGVGSPVRLGGADRYGTAAAISAAHFGTRAPVAYVATGRNFPDALAGGPAAALGGGPVLLTDSATLPAATRDELRRLQPQRIVVLGGTEAVSDAVVAELRSYTGSVTRIGGSDRYATAAAISGATFPDSAAVVFVATGATFPDALAAGPAAAKLRGPVLLTRPGALPPETQAELARLRPQQVYLLGGATAVSDAVLHHIQQYSARPVVRLAGADRYATAVAVSTAFYGVPVSAYVATGRNFPDALAAVPAAAAVGSPLLLVKPNAVPSTVQAELRRLHPPLLVLAGGRAAISDGVVHYLVGLLAKP